MSVTGALSGQTFRNLSTGQGLSQSVITCFYQDSRGYMWIGTQDGLNRYDGYQFTVFRHRDDDLRGSLPSNYIRCIAEDPDGNLWIGTDTTGLALFNRGKEAFTTYQHDPQDHNTLSDNRIRSMVFDTAGNLIIGTQHGLNILNYHTMAVSRYPVDELENQSVNALHIDRSGMLWVGTDNGAFLIDPSANLINTFHNTASDPNSIHNDQIHCFYQDEDGTLYIGTNKGLNRYDRSVNGFHDVLVEDLGQQEKTDLEVNAIIKDRAGYLWAGTFGNGLIGFNEKTGELITFRHDPSQPGTLGSDFVFSLYLDRSGLLWIGTYGGGISHYYRPSVAFNTIAVKETSQPSATSREIYALYPDADNRLWIGTDRGLFVYSMPNERFIPISTRSPGIPAFGEDCIYSITSGPNGSTWIGTTSGKIMVVDKISEEKGIASAVAEAKTLTPADTFISSEINCLLTSHSGTFWAGTSQGIYHLDPEGRIIRSYPADPSDRSDINQKAVYCMHESTSGTLFIGTGNGVGRYNASSDMFEQILLPGNVDITNAPVYSLFLDQESVLWIGTDNEGLFAYNTLNEAVQHYTVKDGLPDLVIYGILEDADQQLWLSTNNGLSRGTRHTGGLPVTFVNYNTTKGLATVTYNPGACAAGRNNLLFFGGSGLITCFDPLQVPGNTYIPPVYITDLQLFYKSVSPAEDGSSPLSAPISETGEIVLRHHQNLLTLTFSALNYQESDKNAYACKLDGYDAQWQFPENRTITYANLLPGRYTFRIKASNNDGIWNENGDSLVITIRPPFSRTIWFFLLMAAGILLSFILISQIRTSQLRNAKKVLEQQVQKRTAQLHETNMNLETGIMERKKIEHQLILKNEELNKILDDLRKTQTHLINSEKMASLGQLTAGIAHEINNPINFVSGNISPLSKDIDDLLSILKTYEEIVRKHNLEQTFQQAGEIKARLDYTYLLDEIHKLLDGMREGALRTSEIVKGLRNFSRLDEHEFKQADIHEGIESTLLILGNRIKTGITVVKKFGSLPKIACYPGQLNQVFMNVLSNAIHAMEGEGTLTITTGMENERMYIRIKDTGKGMTEEVKNRIFEPFYTTKEVGHGTGLGLSISYGIIEKHRGTIHVISEPGKGSEFIIDLPVSQDDN